MTSLTVLSPAKLNLFLHITGRRADGYHELQTVFQLLDHGDDLHFESNDTGEIVLHCNEPALAGPDNLVLRAASALQRTTGTTAGAVIHLHKRIPAGAGLGGGSSNAATTLVALNRLWNTALETEQLCGLGVALGADVPVFVQGTSAWAEGVGDVLIPIDLPEKTYLVITPDCHVSTAEIFSHQQLTRDTTPIKMAAFLAGQTRNDCENLVRRLYPPVDRALNWLSRHATARMTGTGASVFAAFDSYQEAAAVFSRLPAELTGFVARGLQCSDLQPK